MNIALFHERFIFRFGVDRVLLCLAKEFRSLGHTITLVGQNFDGCWADGRFDHLVQLPVFEPYAESDLRAAMWLQANWSKLSPPGRKLDAALVAGWPFFQTVALLKTHGVKTWFQDHGIAPEDGFGEGHKRTIALLRDLKRRFVCMADGIAPVSDFIARSQSITVARPNQEIVVIRNGVDHAALTGGLLQSEARARQESAQTIFSVGRFEPGCYKQSEQVFDLARRLKQQRADHFHISVLAPETLAVPEDLKDCVEATGFLSDEELFRRASQSDVCVCFSRWEGFNLGLAESQALGTPCLVYNCGAHAEVVADAWLLCETLEDFAIKIQALAAGEAPLEITSGASCKQYARARTWRQAAERLLNLFGDPQPPKETRIRFFDRRDVFLMEVGNASRDPANSGVVRVTRQLASCLNSHYGLTFVCWDEGLDDIRFPTLEEVERLCSYGGPTANAWQPLSKSSGEPALVWDYLNPSEELAGWLLLPEIKPPEAVAYLRSQAQRWGLRTAAIFYDAIAVVRPDLVQDTKYREPHLRYMLSLAECDVVIPISRASEDDLRRIWSENGLDGNARTVLLPGGFPGERPPAPETNSKESTALCVSTVEPRKNHRRLIEAFRSYKAAEPTRSLKLVLVGNRYAGAEDLAAFVENSVASAHDLEWRGIVSDEELQELYRKSAFTIYPSEIEGFGLPILESLWYGVPCICHRSGVMAELAAEGGCLTADVTSLKELADAIARMDKDDSLRKTLSGQATARELKTWTNYAQEFMGTLCLARNIDRGQQDSDPAGHLGSCGKSDPGDWRTIVFGDCLHQGWQMSESEKAGLLAIVQSCKPHLAVEIGTYQGGSLSLIRQHAKRVISIDTDPAIGETFAYMDNVTFLTGDSKQLLPLLLAELEAQAVSPDFFLIDGDHSTDGVRADIECVLQIRPRRTCFILLHDMANQTCRAGAMAVDWERYPHVQWVDLDFVPGRLVENGSQFDGQVWGGLGLVVLSPAPRRSALEPVESCKRTLKHLWQAASSGR